jgi:hypothetical protein
MSIILDGTAGITYPNSVLQAGGVSAPATIAQGGTGQTTATAAFNALNPMTTTGDIMYEASPTTAARLPIGTSGQLLTVSGGLPAWAAAPSSGGLTLLGTVTATSGNSLSLGSLDLTSYKYLYISSVGISSSAINGIIFVNANNGQVYGEIHNTSGSSASQITYAFSMIDLASGVILKFAEVNVANSSTYNAIRTDITTATTTIYFRLNSTQTFDAGSFIVYGGK